MEWWVFPALVLCAVTFTAAAGVLVFLAVRGVWRLLARYEPAHAAGPVGESWLPWEGDLRFGSMQLADDVAVGNWHGATMDGAPIFGVPGARGHWVSAPTLDWREVAHGGDWRAGTAADLAPAVLDSGPGGLAWPGPDLASGESAGVVPRHGGESVPGGQPEPEPEPGRTVAGRLVETSDEWLRRLVANAAPGWTYAGTVA